MGEGLGRRLALALGLALAVLAGLHALLGRPRRAETGPPAVSPLVPPAGVLASRDGVLQSLGGTGVDRIWLAADVAELPPRAAPVVRLRSDGRLALERPPPLPRGPVQRWEAAGMVLPVARLESLTGPQRVALLEACAILAADRALEAEGLVPCGVAASVAERARLLRWLR